jgi:hypothetical protein
MTLATLLASCSSGPVPPVWQNNAHQSLETFSTAYLSGNTRLADAEFIRARRELTSTGRFDLVARAELARCGVQVASLEFDDCPGFAALASDADDSERSYAAFLQGKTVTAALLPAQYRSMASGGKIAQTMIEPPLSRLIAAAVSLRRGQLDAEGVADAVDTASAQGWRRPLLAWLEIQARQADSAGQPELAAQARRRHELAVGTN